MIVFWQFMKSLISHQTNYLVLNKRSINTRYLLTFFVVMLKYIIVVLNIHFDYSSGMGME